MNKLLKFTLPGAIATAPMTFVMSYLHRRLPQSEKAPLPPRQITMNIMDKIGAKKYLNEGERKSMTLISHIAYGAIVGALFVPLLKKMPDKKIIAGTGCGFLVWSGSYLGVVPGLGLSRGATEEPLERNALMIAAHLVWGASIGIIVDALDRREKLSGFQGH